MDARAQQDQIIAVLARSVRLALGRDGEDWYVPSVKRARVLAHRLFIDLFDGDIMPLQYKRDLVNDLTAVMRETNRDRENLTEQALFIARMLARHVIDSVVAAGAPQDWVKSWATQDDDRVRPTHKAVDGKTIPVREKFSVGGVDMDGPGDVAAPIQEIAGCRCYLSWGPDEQALAASAGGEIMDDDIDAYTEVPWYGVLAPEGVATGDRRTFDADSLTWRELPLPLRWQKVDAQGHDGSVVVGRIDTIERRDGLLHATGVFSSNAEADEVIGLIAEKAVRGVSVDLDKTEVEYRSKDGGAVQDEHETLADAMAAMESAVVAVKKGRICSGAICAIPAFAEAFVALGYPPIEDEVEELEELFALTAAIDERPWTDYPESAYDPVQWHNACIVHLHDTKATNKGECKLPIRTPKGTLSRAGVHAAAARIGQVDAPASDIAVARRALVRAYEQLGEEPPESLVAAADLEHEYAEFGSHDLIWVSRRRTPKVVSKGAKYEPTEAEGKIVKRRAATEAEEKTIRNGGWVRVNQDDKKPGQPGYMERRSGVRPQNNSADIEEFFAESNEAVDQYVIEPPVTEFTNVAGQLIMADGSTHDIRNVRLTRLDAHGTPTGETTTFGPTSNPSTKDGPGWVTNPRETQRLRSYWTQGRGAAKIGWGLSGDFNRCRTYLAEYVKPNYLAGTCANLHKEALGYWPGQHRGRAASEGTLVAAAWNLVAATEPGFLPPRWWFDDPKFTDVTPLTITQEGRVYGHMAQWGTCHTGFTECVEPPVSYTDYSYFHLGAVLTDDGEVACGSLTVDTGHAGQWDTAGKAMAHYDDTGTVVAYVRAGEDAHGIWFAGSLASRATPEQVETLRGSKLSGDWRPIAGYPRELIACLAVNAPGFPVLRPSLAASAGKVVSLLSAGMVEPAPSGRSDEEIADIVHRALADLREFDAIKAAVIKDRRATLASLNRERN